MGSLIFDFPMEFTMLTQQEIAQRRFDVDDVIASQRLEGLAVDPATLADLEEYVQGHLELVDVMAKAKARNITSAHRAAV